MMTDITACRVINENDNEPITLWTEWSDYGFKITVMPTRTVPLVGEMTVLEMDTFANNLDKTRTEYMEDTKNVLMGKDAKIKFVLQGSTFRWKRRPWTCGMIEMHPLATVEAITNILQKSLERQNNLEDTVSSLQRENTELKMEQARLHERMDDMIGMKNTIEEELYKRFIVVLNSKKKKIRELEDNLLKSLKRNSTERSVYDVETDESDVSDLDTNITMKAVSKKNFKNLRRKRDSGSESENERFSKTRFQLKKGNLSDAEDCEDGKDKKLISKRFNSGKDKAVGQSKKTLSNKSLDRKVAPNKKGNCVSKTQIQNPKPKIDLTSNISREERTWTTSTKVKERNPFDFEPEKEMTNSTVAEDEEVSKLENRYSGLSSNGSDIFQDIKKEGAEQKVTEGVNRSTANVSALNLTEEDPEEDLFD